MEQQKNILGTAPISQLLLKFSVPTVLTLLVNCLYNIVDQIFVGQAVGIDGMAATNVAFPMCTISAALALMVGDGCAANISLYLGKGEQKKAEHILGNACTLLWTVGILLAVVVAIGGESVARLFGASDAVLKDSVLYMRILCIGLPFQMMNMAFTAIIRADGHPQYAMKSMIIGSLLNVILDPVFIFVLQWGIMGAAVATIIGQIVAGSICLRYLPKFEMLKFQKQYLKLETVCCKEVLILGFPSFCTQSAMALTQIVMNHHMRDLGALTQYGSEIPLSCYGMMMKIYQIAHAMFVGVASGTQPINGYNYGSKQYDRVKQTFRMATILCFIISGVWFVIFQTCGGVLSRVFVSDEPLYTEFATVAFRVYMMAFLVYGFPQISASFFQAIGKPWRALVVSISRQILFLIPISYVCSSQFGLTGALMAAPIADGLTFLLAVAMVAFTWRSGVFAHTIEQRENRESR